MMGLIKARHSVRQYLDQPISPEVREELDVFLAACNRESGLNMQILYEEPECFQSRLAHYGKFENVRNYFALVGKKSGDLSEKCGYWGEKLVLKAQELGLNTCWVALTHGKSHAKVAPEEREVILISLGYGKTQGVAHRGKDANAVSNLSEDSPEWFRRGVEAALLAPTALNQQRFFLKRDGGTVRAEAPKFGTNLKVDLGIVKCHFELGAGRENFVWDSQKS